MLIQIAFGTALLLCTIIAAATSAWAMEFAFQRWHRWLLREPHRLKLMLVIGLVSLWALAVVTIGVWVWAVAFYVIGAFTTLEESVYFATVTFTTLGFGDVLLPKEWRLLAGMAAANGLLNFGLLTALMVEALRHVRLGQLAARRPEQVAQGNLALTPLAGSTGNPIGHPKGRHPSAPETPRPAADQAG